MNISSVLDKSPRFLLYALFFLLPVFLVPGLSLPLDLHKQLLLAATVFAAGVLWIVDILRKREVNFRWHILFVPLGLFVLVGFISAFGSGAFLHSFFGANAEPDSFFNILLFTLLFVLIANKLTKKEYVQNALMAFVAGAVLSSLLLFANSLFSFTFSFGSPFAFAIYAGGALMVAVALILTGPPHQSKLGAGQADPVKILSAAILFLTVLFISQWVAWLGIAVGALLLLYFVIKYQHKSARVSINQRLILPLIIFALSLVFLFVDNPLDSVLRLSPEVQVGRGATIDIAKDTISSNTKNALFGSGLATFRNQYRLFRSPDINSSPFWNVSFDRGSGAIASFFATTGVLGGGLIMIFWLWFLWFCTRFFWKRAQNTQISADSKLIIAETESAKISNKSVRISGSILLGGVYFFIAWLLSETNFMLLFAGFSFVALWAGIYGRRKKVVFRGSSSAMFWGMVGGVVALMGFVFGAYSMYRNYSAETYYWQGVSYIDAKDYTLAIPAFQNAVKKRNFDKYLRELSRSLFLRTNEIFYDEELTSQEKEDKAQRGLLAAETSAALALSANPKNSENFEGVGDFYTAAIPLSGGAATMPFAYYNEATKLNPQNPRIPLKKAHAHLASAKRFAAEDTDSARAAYVKAVEEARNEANNALKLKGDFADALDFIASLPPSAE